ncbi:probable tRNA N6-adenosine threonylcarbamoyltransferase, mitochondrial [Copidosoma floridanum]|uniref:probable tRNA N6-adenosine threonylcarbamoyltransferase, mitochondrial n=1 Tax=Copidosoma floridanum TaxID=29053 RepID=UPI0006C96552|nr:probable tRNA N6-adenosine threonylcarbamoyltransferase, mitochondrial [Copidosoma floridanum]
MNQTRQLLGLPKFFRRLCKNHNLYDCAKRHLLTNEKPAVILGIETSCDETGFAIVDTSGKILGEALNSQLVHHLHLGGINPPVARDLHVRNIDNIYQECLKSANMTMNNIDAVAVTIHPGLVMPLCVGRDFALKLSREFDKPLIPIHHMKAHALTARISEKVDFPFLVLLISGGHCILALVQSIEDFKILGYTIDDAPGEALDKVSRRLKMEKIPEYAKVSGGRAIEMAAMKADKPENFEFPTLMSHYRNCKFSFSGVKNKARMHIISEEKKHHIQGDEILPSINNICAGFLLTVTKHLCLRTERAMEFLRKQELLPENNKTLVVSGGVASNNFIAKALEKICSHHDYRLVRPPPKLCSDNGIMIAWNGVEKYKINSGVLRDRSEIDKIDVTPKMPIGEDWSERVTKEGIKRKWVKLKFHDLVES